VEKNMIVSAEWPGCVLDIFVSVGQEVDEDEQLMLIEEGDDDRGQIFVHAPEAGRIAKILVEDGDFAQVDDDLVEIAEFGG
jgi:acetyl-CoA carboxylase biotin carboxyl carrier protein